MSSNSIIYADYVALNQVSTQPASIRSGYGYLWTKTDGTLQYTDDAKVDSTPITQSSQTIAVTLTGPWYSSPICNVVCFKVGGVVTLRIPSMMYLHASSNLISSSGGELVNYAPAADYRATQLYDNNATYITGLMRISVGGNLTFSSEVGSINAKFGNDVYGVDLLGWPYDIVVTYIGT